jgi:hypothetical protein
MPFCPNCGARVSAAGQFCGSCEKSLQRAQVPTVPKGPGTGPTRRILTILAFFLFCVAILASSQGDRCVALGCLVGAIACFTPMWRFMRQKSTESRAIEQMQLQTALNSANNEAAQFQNVSGISRLPNLTKDALDIILGSEERCFAMSRNARHIVSQKRTTFVGQTAGISHKISKNTRVRLGGFQGEPRTTVYGEETDTGTVYVTNERFIFGGTKEVVTVPIEKIAKVAVAGDNDIVQVLVENREAPVTVRMTEQFRAPVIAAATECMVKHALGHKVAGKSR